MATVYCGVPSASARSTPLPRGTIVVPRGSGVALIDATSGAERLVSATPSIGVTGHAAWSRDGSRIVLSRFGRQPGERLGGSDILVVDAGGGQARPLAEHGGEGIMLRAPFWNPDGRGVFFDFLPASGDLRASRVERVALDGSAPLTVAAPGAWPGVAPDGRTLVYARPSAEDRDFDELVLLPLDGGPERVLVPGGRFVQVGSPRFSPDGTRIAFIGALTTGEELGRRGSLANLMPPPKRLHGPPGDIWIVPLDGAPPWQRTAFLEDEPTLAWSPDGAWLAMLAGGGLYLVGAGSSGPAHLLATGGFGGIDWR